MANIRRDITHIPIPTLVSDGQAISTAMTGNAKYTSISAKVAAFTAKLGALKTASEAYATWESQGPALLLLRKNARLAYEAEFNILATATETVTTLAEDLLAAKWEIRTTGAPPVGNLATPQDLHATGGDHEGTVDLAWNPVKGRKFYRLELATAFGGPWSNCYADTKSSCTIAGLVPGMAYWFRVCARGTAGDSPWSDPATMRAT